MGRHRRAPGRWRCGLHLLRLLKLYSVRLKLSVQADVIYVSDCSISSPIGQYADGNSVACGAAGADIIDGEQTYKRQ